MFCYQELLNLDVRDRSFWLRAARRKVILDQMRAIAAVRAGMAENNTYKDIMNELNDQLNELDGQNIIEKNWEELKEIGRRYAQRSKV